VIRKLSSRETVRAAIHAAKLAKPYTLVVLDSTEQLSLAGVTTQVISVTLEALRSEMRAQQALSASA